MTRRLTIIPYVLEKYSGWARIRAAWHYIVRGYESEVCFSCGRPVEVVWHVPDWIWEAVIDGPGGIRCPRCFVKQHYDSTGRNLRFVGGPLL